MAVFLFLVASLGGVGVGDLLLENPSAGEATVFTQPVSGYRQGMLLAMAAALGSVVALLLVASMTSTRTRPARRKQLRTIRAGTQRQAAAPAREQTSLLDERLGRHVPHCDLGQPIR
jgi:Na+/proline symporter